MKAKKGRGRPPHASPKKPIAARGYKQTQGLTRQVTNVGHLHLGTRVCSFFTAPAPPYITSAHVQHTGRSRKGRGCYGSPTLANFPPFNVNPELNRCLSLCIRDDTRTNEKKEEKSCTHLPRPPRRIISDGCCACYATLEDIIIPAFIARLFRSRIIAFGKKTLKTFKEEGSRCRQDVHPSILTLSRTQTLNIV